MLSGSPAPLSILLKCYVSFELASSSRKLPLTTRTPRDLFLSFGLVNSAELMTSHQLRIVCFPFTLFAEHIKVASRLLAHALLFTPINPRNAGYI